ncbi:hypothetical protein [Pasteurella sp. PK-2025]|uniref:hypothetical protein n=1 Tax=Pasteurella sp. PK-2025 TaxID=3413133 RepID=UPI003C70D41A
MNMREVFIKQIYQQIGVEGINMITSILNDPPGRKPKQKLKELSEYVNSKSEDEKKKIIEIIELSINSTIFNMLCVFDQVNKLDDNIDNIKLSILCNNQEILLNDFTKQDLHDLFNIETGNTR